MITFAVNMHEDIQQALRDAVERKFGRHLTVRGDFDTFVLELENSIHEHLSGTTLRRFWGYQADQNANTSLTTLNILSRYCGYNDFHIFKAKYERDKMMEGDSHFTDSESIFCNNLTLGQLIQLTWNPDRCVTVRYEGKEHFTIVESINSKLSSDIEFDCSVLLDGEPLTMINLSLHGTNLHNYICGAKDGIHFKMLS